MPQGENNNGGDFEDDREDHINSCDALDQPSHLFGELATLINEAQALREDSPDLARAIHSGFLGLRAQVDFALDSFTIPAAGYIMQPERELPPATNTIVAMVRNDVVDDDDKYEWEIEQTDPDRTSFHLYVDGDHGETYDVEVFSDKTENGTTWKYNVLREDSPGKGYEFMAEGPDKTGKTSIFTAMKMAEAYMDKLLGIS